MIIMKPLIFKKNIHHDNIAYIFILPFFIIFTYFYFFPVFKVVADSFTDYDLFTKRNYIGIDNYINMFSDDRFIKSVYNTFFYSIFTLFPTMAIGLIIALLANNTIIKTNGSRMLIFMPRIVSMVAVSMIWLYLYEPTSGVFNSILSFFGFKKSNFLLDPNLSMWCLIVMGIWKGIGYNMIIFLSGLKSIPMEYYEAAKMDGSGVLNTFVKITYPLLGPTTTFLFITGVIASFNVFEQVNVMTNGGPLNTTTTMVHQIYTAGFSDYKLGYASAMSVFLLVIVVIVTIINFNVTRNKEA